MDDILIPFHRQYLQQVHPTNIRYPPPKHLVISYVQDQISRYFFEDARDAHLPPPQYQRKVLKRIIADIECELDKGDYDPDEYAVSDALMTHMGLLAVLPQVSDTEAAQSLRTLSYFLPTNALVRVRPNESEPTDQSKGQRILIRESPNLLAAGANVGLRTWEACLHLAYYLCTCPGLESKHPNGRTITGSNIIELGAGTGLLSLICAQYLGAKHILATDGLPHVVEGVKVNLALNNTTATLSSDKIITPAVLDWSDHSHLDELLSNEESNFDYILGADITYHPELHEPLASIIKILKRRYPEARALISTTVRNEVSMQHFRDVCQREHGLTIRDITEQEWKCPDFRDQTGLFHEQAFPNVIMEIDIASHHACQGVRQDKQATDID